jgi:adenylate cyclase
MSETRKLAAILVSDVVGYSRLAGADEERILARLRALRSDLIDPTISVHHGRIVKRTGDGSVIEFRSVVDAVRCALEVQHAMIDRNAGVAFDKQIEFRIGIHLGDVVEESDGDLMGEGVNIAARLEGVCAPGAICLSEDAYRQVKGRLDLAVSDLGQTQLKNIAEPIRVYSLQVGVPAQAKPAMAAKPPEAKGRAQLAFVAAGIAALFAVVTGAWHFLDANRSTAVAAPAVAVLPFDNLGGDEQSSRLADGMTEDVITDLARYKDLLVIARNSTLTYKGKPVDARQVAKDLNVRYVLAGSIQHQADQLRVTAELIDAATGAQVWSEHWDRPAQDMFSVQAEVADKVAASLGGNSGSNLGAISGRLMLEAKRAPANLSAYQFWLLAREQVRLNNKAANVKGLEYAEKAIALDPNFATAYVVRAWLKYQKSWVSDFPWVTQIREFESDLRLALSLDPSNVDAHAGLMRYLGDTGQFTEASAEIDRTVRDNPTNNNVLTIALAELVYLGRPEEGVAMADLTLRLDPQMPPTKLGYLMNAYFFGRKFDRVIELSNQIPEETRDNSNRFLRAASYAFLGRAEDAERAKADLIAKNGEQVEELWLNEGNVFPRTIEQDFEREAFRKLGLRICATEEELKKYDNPKRLPECVKT